MPVDDTFKNALKESMNSLAAKTQPASERQTSTKHEQSNSSGVGHSQNTPKSQKLNLMEIISSQSGKSAKDT